jgi:hypothetical protein
MRLSAGIGSPLCGWSWIEQHEINTKGGENDLTIAHLDVDAVRLRVNRLCETERLRRRGELKFKR